MIIFPIKNVSAQAFLSLSKADIQKRFKETQARQEEERSRDTGVGEQTDMLGGELLQSGSSPSCETPTLPENKTQHSSSDPVLRPSPYGRLRHSCPRSWKVSKKISSRVSNLSAQEYTDRFNS